MLEKGRVFGYSVAHGMAGSAYYKLRCLSVLFVGKAAESSNGRTTVSGTVYLGSSPGSAALKINT